MPVPYKKVRVITETYIEGRRAKCGDVLTMPSGQAKALLRMKRVEAVAEVEEKDGDEAGGGPAAVGGAQAAGGAPAKTTAATTPATGKPKA